MKLGQEIIKKLIELGNEQSLDDIVVAEKYCGLRGKDSINRLHWRDWDEVTCDLNTEDLIALIKALTTCERFFDWSGGSVSSVIWNFKELERRDHALSRSLADWILPRTTNGYIPWGTHNFDAKSVKEYKRLNAENSARIQRGLQADALIEENAAKQRAIRSKQREVSRDQRNTEARETFFTDFGNLTITEKLQRIALDDIHSIGFYPTNCANQADQKTIGQLDEATRLKLLEKLKGRQRGPWKRFKKRLLLTFRKNPWDNRRNDGGWPIK